MGNVCPFRTALRGKSGAHPHHFSYLPLSPPSPNLLICFRVVNLILLISKNNKRDPSKTILTTAFDFVSTKLQLFSLISVHLVDCSALNIWQLQKVAKLAPSGKNFPACSARLSFPSLEAALRGLGATISKMGKKG